LFESRRRANAQRKTAQAITVAFAFLALFLFFLGLGTSSPAFYYIALMLLVFAGLTLVSGAGTWGIGAEGEEIVAQHLKALGNPYRVIHDVVLPEIGGNIDHIILGPNGIFVIETKNHNGLITCNGDFWTQRKIGQLGTPYLGRIGYPSKQIKRNAISLRNLIRDRLDMNLYVNCAIVFTNKDAVLRINNPTVAVLRPNELCGFVKTHNSGWILRNKELEELETAIRPYSQFN